MMFSKIFEKIKKSNKIAIFSHTRPDGDTIGGVLALKLALQSIGKKCDAFCDVAISEKFLFLPQADSYALCPQDKYDLYIAVDCGENARLGENFVYFNNKNNTINIDHHATNDMFAGLNYVTNYASTCEIVYELIKFMKIPFTSDIALCLYTGMSTDTGNFSHSNTDKHVFECASDLVSYGINVAEINFILYKNTSFERTKLLGKVISRIRRYCDNKVSLIYTLLSDIQEVGAKQSDTEGFIDYATNIAGTQVGVSICQHTENSFKISMRSRGDVDVSRICAEFGGGGHKKASGCMISGFFEDVVDKVIRTISFEL